MLVDTENGVVEIDKEKLPYRQGVIALIVDDDDNALIVQMVDYQENQWRFPGGGIDTGEFDEIALHRELEEELGLDSGIAILGKSRTINQYDWPEEVILRRYKKDGVLYRGQQQKQFCMLFMGDKERIKLDPKEIRQVKWVPVTDLEQYMIFPGQWEKVEALIEEMHLLEE